MIPLVLMLTLYPLLPPNDNAEGTRLPGEGNVQGNIVAIGNTLYALVGRDQKIPNDFGPPFLWPYYVEMFKSTDGGRTWVDHDLAVTDVYPYSRDDIENASPTASLSRKGTDLYGAWRRRWLDSPAGLNIGRLRYDASADDWKEDEYLDFGFYVEPEWNSGIWWQGFRSNGDYLVVSQDTPENIDYEFGTISDNGRIAVWKYAASTWTKIAAWDLGLPVDAELAGVAIDQNDNLHIFAWRNLWDLSGDNGGNIWEKFGLYYTNVASDDTPGSWTLIEDNVEIDYNGVGGHWCSVAIHAGKIAYAWKYRADADTSVGEIHAIIGDLSDPLIPTWGTVELISDTIVNPTEDWIFSLQVGWDRPSGTLRAYWLTRYPEAHLTANPLKLYGSERDSGGTWSAPELLYETGDGGNATYGVIAVNVLELDAGIGLLLDLRGPSINGQHFEQVYYAGPELVLVPGNFAMLGPAVFPTNFGYLG